MKPQLVADYVETGQVYLEFRDFGHLGEGSVRAAEAAACAADQDAFWDYNETLFANQQGAPYNTGAYSTDRLVEMAEQLELDTDEFESCLESDTYEDDIQESIEQAQSAGVTGTPGFQINGRVVEWDGYEQLAAEIEAELE